MRFSIIFPLILTAGLSAQQVKPVAIAGKTAPRNGTVLREKREILVEKGTFTLQRASGDQRSLATRWMQRYQMVRRIQGAGAEEVEMREHVFAQSQFPLNGTPSNAGESRGELNSTTLLARQRSGGWTYELKGQKATERQNAALLDLQFFANMMEIVPAALGSQTRRPGETWKPSIPTPRGKAYGQPVFKNVEVTFGSIEERQDGPHAKLFIAGSFTMERPMNMLASIDISFGISLTRRLTDMLDVETEISGTFKNRLQAGFSDGTAGIVLNDYPYVVKRTISIEK